MQPNRLGLTAILALLLATTAHARTCILEPSEFNFQDKGKGSSFGQGTQADADIAYTVLDKELGDLSAYPTATIFYVKSRTTIVRHECPGEKCAAQEMMLAWKTCSDGAKVIEDICIPLAVVHDRKLYCLLQPNAPFDPKKPFVPYRPPFDR